MRRIVSGAMLLLLLITVLTLGVNLLIVESEGTVVIETFYLAVTDGSLTAVGRVYSSVWSATTADIGGDRGADFIV